MLVASRGDLEIYGFHALETLQCMVERRQRNGKPQGVAAVTCLEGTPSGKRATAAFGRGICSSMLSAAAIPATSVISSRIRVIYASQTARA